MVVFKRVERVSASVRARVSLYLMGSCCVCRVTRQRLSKDFLPTSNNCAVCGSSHFNNDKKCKVILKTRG